LIQTFHGEGGLWKANPVNSTPKDPVERMVHLEKCELDARRATIQGKDK
jgi:hypothetical protein